MCFDMVKIFLFKNKDKHINEVSYLQTFIQSLSASGALEVKQIYCLWKQKHRNFQQRASCHKS